MRRHVFDSLAVDPYFTTVPDRVAVLVAGA
jgi:hypothetical protein